MKRSELLFIAIKPPLDYLALVLAAIFAYSIRYIEAIQSIRPVIFDLPFKDYFSLSVIFAFLWIIIFALSGLYTVEGTKNFKNEFTKVFIGCTAGLALVLAAMVFSRFLFDSRFIIIAGWILAITMVSFERLIIKLIQKYTYKFGFGIHRVVIVGSGDIAQELSKEFNHHTSLGFKVVAQFPELNQQTMQSLDSMAKDYKLDEIIQINPSHDLTQTMELIDFVNANHIDYKYTADLLGTQLINLEVLTYAGTPVIEVKKTRLDGWGKIYKRIFDIFSSIIFIILFSPIMILVGLIIKLTSPGSILFMYKRIGQYGKQFAYFKFRSMVQNAHQKRFDPGFVSANENIRDGSPMIKFKQDPRITPFGKFIRRFSLDELPEFFLVLTGKMSIVGPRPHEIEEVDKYQKHHKRLLTIKPGITGLSQVSGRSDLDFEEEVKLDTYYIENWSLGLDLQILFKTPWAVLRGRQTE